MITFRGIKSFLGFLSLEIYLTIETTQRKTKKARKALIGGIKGAQARKARINAGKGD